MLFALVAGCESASTPATTTVARKDGDMDFPTSYRTWPVFVEGTARKDKGQVRDIYINAVGTTAKAGAPFPDGSELAMDIFEAATDSTGAFVKGKLLKVYLMQKVHGAGAGLKAGTIPNGDWIYGAWMADTHTPTGEDFATCRACHTPQAGSDYLFKTDLYFAKP
jgi:hemoglobin